MYLFHRIEIITIFAPDFIEVQFGKSILYFDRLKWKFGHRNLIRQISVRMLLPGMYIHRYGHTVPCCIYPRWELQTFTISSWVSQIPHLGLWSEVALTFLFELHDPIIQDLLQTFNPWWVLSFQQPKDGKMMSTASMHIIWWQMAALSNWDSLNLSCTAAKSVRMNTLLPVTRKTNNLFPQRYIRKWNLLSLISFPTLKSSSTPLPFSRKPTYL